MCVVCRVCCMMYDVMFRDGVLMLCDPRLRTKSYGKTFLKSLPVMSQTDTIDRVKAFYNYYQPDEAETA